MAAGTLHVTIVKATRLQDLDWIGKTDPYVKFWVGAAKPEQTSTKNNCVEPVWNETKSFSNVTANQTLNIEMYDDDIGRDEKLGTATVALNDLVINEPKELTLPNFAKTGQLVIRLRAEGFGHPPAAPPQTPPKADAHAAAPAAAPASTPSRPADSSTSATSATASLAALVDDLQKMIETRHQQVAKQLQQLQQEGPPKSSVRVALPRRLDIEEFRYVEEHKVAQHLEGLVLALIESRNPHPEEVIQQAIAAAKKK